jgi:hypothetical protein
LSACLDRSLIDVVSMFKSSAYVQSAIWCCTLDCRSDIVLNWYPRPPTFNQRIRGSISRMNRYGDRLSPWIVPLYLAVLYLAVLWLQP